MALTVPSLDDRSYQQLVREALARIPVHNPEWTNFNDSDPGVTLVQLFAFMTESLLYRANQIPERNRRKFLTLLGIGVRPAESARGLITIQNERGPLDPQTFDAGLDVRAGAVPFRTTQGLQVLPVEARVFYKRKPQPGELSAEQQEHYKLLYADLIDAPGKQLSFYDSTPLNAPAPGAALPVVDLVTDTVDRCLWIALLARPNESPDVTRAVMAGQTLTIGVMPGVTAEGMVLPEGRASIAGAEARIAWEIAQPPPDGLLPPSNSAARRQASYALLDARSSGDILAAPGLVELTLPTQLRNPKENAGIWRNLEPAEEGTG
ncbi:MAG TPA: hypothetical protein VF909_14795, partial [Roseiflexaceae bacterium]